MLCNKLLKNQQRASIIFKAIEYVNWMYFNLKITVLMH